MNKPIYLATLAGAALLVSSSMTFAQQQGSAATPPGRGMRHDQGMPMQGHSMPTGQGMTHSHGATPGQGNSPSSAAYMEGMAKMNRDMQMPMTGNADHDFAMMMIPHHQGAIDMARVQLQHGKDPKLRKMAQQIIKDQEKEIGDFQKWLNQPKR